MCCIGQDVILIWCRLRKCSMFHIMFRLELNKGHSSISSLLFFIHKTHLCQPDRFDLVTHISGFIKLKKDYRKCSNEDRFLALTSLFSLSLHHGFYSGDSFEMFLFLPNSVVILSSKSTLITMVKTFYLFRVTSNLAVYSRWDSVCVWQMSWHSLFMTHCNAFH